MAGELLQLPGDSKFVNLEALPAPADGPNIQTGQPLPQQLALPRIIPADVRTIRALLEVILSLAMQGRKHAVLLAILPPG